MDTVRAWLARLFMMPARRRNWIFVGMVAAWFVGCQVVGALLDRRDPLFWLAVPVLGWGGLISLVNIRTAMTTGMLFGRLVPLPHAELVRYAADRFSDVETWTSPASPNDVLARLAEPGLDATPTSVQRLPDAIVLQFRGRHQPEPWPSTGSLPRRVKIRARVLILVAARADGGTTVDAHWDGTSRLTDTMRAQAHLGRDVVDAARALTEQAEREPDATSGSDR